MGKGKGKKSRKGDLKKKKEPKIKALASAKPPNPLKIANKLAAKKKREARIAELKEAIAKDPSLLKAFPTPMQRTEPFMKNPNAAKWPHLFKRQLGLIEMHIDSLSRIMDAMKNDGDTMSEKDRLDWELGERGNWRAICGMMDRARLVLSQTKEAAQGVLDPARLADKKKLGVVGTTFVPLVPQLDEKARLLGYDPKGKGALGRSMDYLDKDGDTDMSDSSDSSDDSDSDEEAEGADFITLDGKNKKKKSKPTGEASAPESKEVTNGTEPNQFFVVDTNPTPVDLNALKAPLAPPADGLSNRQRKKLEKAKAKEERTARRMAKKAEYDAKKKAAAKGEVSEPEKPQPQSPKVDFRALEAKLQAEIADGTKAQQEAEAEAAEDAEKRSKKKRRRSSEAGEEVVEKKFKKEKKGEEAVEKKVKTEKKEKKEKEKKRKADEEVVEDDGGKKKKRKQKTEDSE